MIQLRILGRRNVPTNRRLQPRRRLEVETLEDRQLLSAAVVATTPTAAEQAPIGPSNVRAT